MHNPGSNVEYRISVEDFRRARRQAALEEILGKVTGKSTRLIPFDEVQKRINKQSMIKRGLQDIPLDAIVGSVGRYTDFTRTFLPKYDQDLERWAGVKESIGRRGMNPIEVYKMDQVYFVLDGNHRVSIARSRGDPTIQANVTEVLTSARLNPEQDTDEFILEFERANFLDITHLEKSRPQANLRVSAPGNYRTLLQHIAAVGDYDPEKKGAEFDWVRSAAKWYDENYSKVVQIIRRRGLQRDFPGRTETDLYVWITRKQIELEETLGWDVPLGVTAEEFRREKSPSPKNIIQRVGIQFLEKIRPPPFDPGPPPGQWRAWALSTHRAERLFIDYLVPISGHPDGWKGLDQALIFAQMEGDHLHGLHVVPKDKDLKSARIADIQEKFDQRCRDAGIKGDLKIEVGQTVQKISEYARWTDLVVASLSHPPKKHPSAKLKSGMSRLIRQSPRPLLLVPRVSKQLKRILLAFDGSPKSLEALYVSTYLTGKWGMKFDIVTIMEPGRIDRSIHESLKQYLQMRRVYANLISRTGKVAETILQTAEEQGSDEIIMGGYGYSPVLDLLLGSTVDQVLRETTVPVVVCR